MTRERKMERGLNDQELMGERPEIPGDIIPNHWRTRLKTAKELTGRPLKTRLQIAKGNFIDVDANKVISIKPDVNREGYFRVHHKGNKFLVAGAAIIAMAAAIAIRQKHKK